MRKVWLNREDFGLFHQDITPYEYEFFRAHAGAFKRMWQEQTRRFWGVFVNTFEQFIWNYGIMKDFPMKSEDIHEYIDEIIFYIRDQFVDGKASTAKNLIMDSVIVTQNRHCIAMLDKVSYAQNPFYMKETREIFRQLFGPPNSKRTFMKVLCGLPVYIKFAGSAVMLLRRWLDADDIPSEDEDGKNDYFRNIHCQGGRMEEPPSLELALSRFKEKERQKKRLAIEAASIEAVTRYTETGGSKTSGKKKSKYTSTGGVQTKTKMKTDQGTQTGPEEATGGTERAAREDLLPAATSKNPAEMDTTPLSVSNSVACGSDSEMLLDSKYKEGGGEESGKKKRKKRKAKSGSSTESKKAVKEAGIETIGKVEEKEGGESTPSDKPLPVSGESKDDKVDGGGGKPTSDRGEEPVAKEDSGVAKENNGEDVGIKEDAKEESSVAKVDNGVAKEDNKVDGVAKDKGDDGVAKDDNGVAKDDNGVAKESGDREEVQATTGNGRKKLHMCACCGLAETLAKTFKRCQKCRGKPNPKYYCSRECQAKHWKTHRLDHKEE